MTCYTDNITFIIVCTVYISAKTCMHEIFEIIYIFIVTFSDINRK